jgi:hypothetical protein
MTQKFPVYCPPMSDLDGPTAVMAVLIQERRDAVQAFLNATPLAGLGVWTSCTRFVERADLLLNSLSDFREACEVESPGDAMRTESGKALVNIEQRLDTLRAAVALHRGQEGQASHEARDAMIATLTGMLRAARKL